MNVKKYQEHRIQNFIDIRCQLAKISLLIEDARIREMEYYEENPNSYGINVPTSMIKGMLDDIEELLNTNERNA